MVNYGYTCKGWSKKKKELLAHKLRCLLMKKDYSNIEHEVDNPYVEIDNLYEGVRIRKITYLTDEQVKELVKEADQIKLEMDKD